jgi:hypothetical protein
MGWTMRTEFPAGTGGFLYVCSDAHPSHKDTEQSIIEASTTLDGVTPTDSLIR